MSLEKPPQNNEFHEKFPHLLHHDLTKEQQDRFLILHAHNEKQAEVDKKREEQLLKQLIDVTTTKSIATQEKPIPQEISLQENLAPSKSLTTKKVVTNVVDFVPVVGSAKMILEGVQGRQLGTGKDITGFGRVMHTVSGATFLALDVTGVGAIASSFGKGFLKVGERLLVRQIEKSGEKVVGQAGERVAKQSMEEVAARNIEKESTKLANRGKKRIDIQENVASSPDAGTKNVENRESQKTPEDVHPALKKMTPEDFAQKILSKQELKNFETVTNSTKEELAQNFIASKLQEKRLTMKEVITAGGLATGLYLTVPTAVSLSQASILSWLSPTLASAITAIQGSSIATAVLPASFLSSLSGASALTFGAAFMSLPLLAQAAIIVPPLVAAGYIGVKTFRAVKNFFNERAFKKQFGVSVSDVVNKSTEVTSKN